MGDGHPSTFGRAFCCSVKRYSAGSRSLAGPVTTSPLGSCTDLISVLFWRRISKPFLMTVSPLGSLISRGFNAARFFRLTVLRCESSRREVLSMTARRCILR